MVNTIAHILTCIIFIVAGILVLALSWKMYKKTIAVIGWPIPVGIGIGLCIFSEATFLYSLIAYVVMMWVFVNYKPLLIGFYFGSGKAKEHFDRFW